MIRLLKNKHILVVGAGAENRVNLWKRLTDSDVNIHIIDQKPRPDLEEFVKNYFTIPHLANPNPTEKYLPKSIHVSSENDLKNVLETVDFPIVMKPDCGWHSICVKRIDNPVNAFDHFHDIHHLSSKLGVSPDVQVMEYVEGDHLEVSLLLANGELLAGFLLRNGPKREPTFNLTTMCMPTLLGPDIEKSAIKCAHQVVCDIGLANGAFDIDMMMTKDGPKFLEINPRASGGVLCTWPTLVYGVDSLIAALCISCRIRPLIQPSDPTCFMMCYNVTPDRHQRALKVWDTREKLENYFREKKNIFFEPLDKDFNVGITERIIFQIYSQAGDPDTAKGNLIEVLRDLQFSPDDAGLDVETLFSFQRRTFTKNV